VGLGLRHGIWSVLGHCSVAGEEAKVGLTGKYLLNFTWKKLFIIIACLCVCFVRLSVLSFCGLTTIFVILRCCQTWLTFWRSSLYCWRKMYAFTRV